MVYELRADDLTGLGGPMGTEVVRTRWRFLFEKVESAMVYAEKDYHDLTGEKFAWVTNGSIHDRLDGLVARSPDLGSTMYHIHVWEVRH